MNYLDMTVWQLEQEKAKIEAELHSRRELHRRVKELYIHYSPHRSEVTATDATGPNTAKGKS